MSSNTLVTRLRASEQAAREALHDLQESSEKRESELQETITMLEHRLSVQERELVAVGKNTIG